jgi:hypothetical protein
MAKRTDTIVASGEWGTVEYAVAADGSVPARLFLAECDDNVAAKLFALFERLAKVGRLSNQQQFRKERGEIWGFKHFQTRMACFRVANRWFLTHGFTKKKDNWPAGQLERAERIMEEYKRSLRAEGTAC